MSLHYATTVEIWSFCKVNNREKERDIAIVMTTIGIRFFILDDKKTKHIFAVIQPSILQQC